ncbi:unnamed protein product [Dovyalis caffra]|uniref:Uncharacterized protein n=1 Tax=Dovyalis caffra TaxID=77055 RepID=A0AAV1RRU5_9ROSI|nr:unnamed protein product [Dovyalis caffra]
MENNGCNRSVDNIISNKDVFVNHPSTIPSLGFGILVEEEVLVVNPSKGIPNLPWFLMAIKITKRDEWNRRERKALALLVEIMGDKITVRRMECETNWNPEKNPRVLLDNFLSKEPTTTMEEEEQAIV